MLMAINGSLSHIGRRSATCGFRLARAPMSCFHFQVLDFGDPIPLREAMMRSTGNTENVERNQCVLLRISAIMFWNDSGMSKRVPDRGECLRYLEN